MLAFDLIRHGRLRTVCAFCAVLLLTLGLNGGGCNPPLCTDAACDDGDFCNGAETCGSDGGCDAGVPPCAEGETCNEATDMCDFVCTAAADCDDSDACTTDACLNGECVNAAAVCPDGQTCNPTTGDCEADIECETSSSCDDGDACNGVETCVDNVCVFGTAPDCDDDDACTTDACASATGCVNTDVVCPVGETCDPTTGDCAAQCNVNADCPNDGLFCNGTESCLAGLCVSSGDPCDAAAMEECDEALNDCISLGDEGGDLTLGLDALNGTGGDDGFTGPLVFNPPTATSIPSFQNSDAVNGGDGTDRLSAFLNFTAVTSVAATLTSVEILNFTDIGTAATTLVGTNWTGVDEVNSVNSSNTNVPFISDLPNIVDVGLSNTTSGLFVGFRTAATSGANDTLNLSLNNAGNATTNGIVGLISGTSNGFESFIVTVAGTNVLAQLMQDVGAMSLNMITFTGSGSLDVNIPLDDTVVTVAAGTLTGNLEIALGNGVVTVTGGAGDDKFIFGANYTSADIINGGAGTNTLSMTWAVSGPTTNQTNVSNIQTLEVSDIAGAFIDASRFGMITTFNVLAGSIGGRVTLPTGSTVNFGTRGVSTVSPGSFGVTVSGASTTDAITFNVNDMDLLDLYFVTGVETLNLVSNVNANGSAASGGANEIQVLILTDSAASEVLNVTGTEAITFGGAVGGSITANTINAATFAHDFTMTLGTTSLTMAGTVTTGTGNDTIVGSAGADIINSGAGNDVVRGGAGQDIVNVGTGSDVLDMEDLNFAALIAANRKTVSGMTIDGTDDTATNETDGIRIGTVTTVGDLSDGGATAELQTATTAGNQVFNGTAAVLELAFEFTSSQDLDNSNDGTNLLAGCGATTGSTACVLSVATDDNNQIIIAYQSGNAYIYFVNDSNVADAGALAAGEIALIAIINGGVTVGGFVATNFNN